jgi:ribonuclease III
MTSISPSSITPSAISPTTFSPTAGGEKDPAILAALYADKFGYHFRNPDLLLGAMTHASSAQHRLSSNERLEFLGDAILGAVVCEMLYRRFPDYLEGDLTKIKSVVVSRLTLAKLSQEAGLQDLLIMGKGMSVHAEIPLSLLADAFESLIAALYLDGGHNAAHDFIVQRIAPEIEQAAQGDNAMNYKSTLQQYAQREHGVTPNYLLLDEKGPDHSKCFQIAATVGKTRYQPAWGRNKKEAEQRAAQNALCEMRGESVPHSAELV